MHSPEPYFFKVDWQEIFKEDLLTQLIDTGFVVFDNLFEPVALHLLQLESGFIKYRDANLTQGIRVAKIRGDKIHWIDKFDNAGSAYLQVIDQLSQFTNQHLFTGIRNSEAHCAYYPIGFGYDWHSDNPINQDTRVLSAVFYLNDDWLEKDGGAIELVDKLGKHHTLLPKANRLLVFDSNLQHQVQIAHRKRFSIATWMRRDGVSSW